MNENTGILISLGCENTVYQWSEEGRDQIYVNIEELDIWGVTGRCRQVSIIPPVSLSHEGHGKAKLWLFVCTGYSQHKG